MDRTALLEKLESHYRGSGWAVKRASDGTLYANGPGGVTWLGTAITPDDLTSGELEQRLADLSERRMENGGELCPLDVVAPKQCETEIRELMARVGLADRRHVSIYAVAA